jgi:hypothetical protein
MHRIVGNDKHRALAWAMPRLAISSTDGWEHFSALYLEKEGDIQAVVLYKEYIPKNSVEVHLAAVSGGRWTIGGAAHNGVGRRRQSPKHPMDRALWFCAGGAGAGSMGSRDRYSDLRAFEARVPIYRGI